MLTFLYIGTINEISGILLANHILISLKIIYLANLWTFSLMRTYFRMTPQNALKS